MSWPNPAVDDVGCDTSFETTSEAQPHGWYSKENLNKGRNGKHCLGIVFVLHSSTLPDDDDVFFLSLFLEKKNRRVFISTLLCLWPMSHLVTACAYFSYYDKLHCYEYNTNSLCEIRNRLFFF